MLDMAYVINSKTTYKCDYCGYHLGQIDEIPEEWNYCPKCAETLQCEESE